MSRRRAHTAAEEDTFYGPWRRLYCYLQRAGAAKGIKRQARRRERREAKTEMRKERE